MGQNFILNGLKIQSNGPLIWGNIRPLGSPTPTSISPTPPHFLHTLSLLISFTSLHRTLFTSRHHISQSSLASLASLQIITLFTLRFTPYFIHFSSSRLAFREHHKLSHFYAHSRAHFSHSKNSRIPITTSVTPCHTLYTIYPAPPPYPTTPYHIPYIPYH